MNEDIEIITGDQALDALRKAVNFRGDGWVDPGNEDPRGCKYVRDGHPACIIGQALSYLGVSVVELISMDSGFDNVIDDSRTQSRLRESGYVLDGLALRRFVAAQYTQDGGGTWGKALAKAEAIAN
jgi:hypothetical protein